MRDRLLAAARTRLQSITASDDLLLIAQPEAVEEIHGLWAVLSADRGDIEVQHTLGWLCWYLWVHSSQGEVDGNLRWAVALLLSPHAIGYGPLPAPLLPVLERVNGQPRLPEEGGAQAVQDVLNTFIEPLMEAAVELWSRKIAAMPAGERGRSDYVGARGTIIFKRFIITRNAEYLHSAIAAMREAVAGAQESGIRQGWHLEQLCEMLCEKVSLTRKFEDVSEAISIAQKAVTVAHVDDALYAHCLNLLGVLLAEKARFTKNLDDLNSAVSAGQEAVAVDPESVSNHANHLANLCATLIERYRWIDALEDLDAAVAAGTTAVATAAHDESRARAKYNLGIAVRLRAYATRETFDYEHLAANSTLDLDATISVLRTAAEDNPDQDPALLGNMLGARFERTGALEDIDESVALLQEAVADARIDDPEHAPDFANLGVSLFRRFERIGRASDLDASVAATQAALAAVSDDHPARTLWLRHLGDGLRARSERTETAEQAIEDLDAAATAMQEALARASADDPHRAPTLASLTAIFAQRFRKTRIQDDLDKAIDAGEGAIAAVSTAHPSVRAAIFNNAGLAWFMRFMQIGEIADGDQAVATLQSAVDATPQGHPDRATHLYSLGSALSERAKRHMAQADKSSALADEHDAAEICSQAAQVPGTAAWVRIHAGRLAGALLAQTSPSRAANLLEESVRLLPGIAPRQLDRGSQQRMLSTFDGLASESAALALDPATGTTKQARAERALGLLELGRAVLLSQAIETRSDLTDLADQHPRLAAKYVEQREQLGAVMSIDTSVLSAMYSAAAMPWQGYVEAQRRAAEAFDRTLNEIRTTPGFEGFALPDQPSKLTQYGKDGPVAVINVAAHRSDAILIRPSEEITSVNLPKITPDILTDKVLSFHLALEAMQREDGGRDHREDAQEGINEILEWLWEAVSEPILKALGLNDQIAPGIDEWPHVWWVPCGLLGLLPIHAAGYHRLASAPSEGDPHGDPGSTGRTVIDRVISSYAPSLRTLGYAREGNESSAVIDQALIVAMPTTPYAKPLRNAVKEALLLKRGHFPDAVLLIEEEARQCSDSAPTKVNVLTQLAHCSVAHFACHGISDFTDPAQSRLLLHDHRSDALTVESLAAEHFHHAKLCYLSACQTALNRKISLIDEAIHMTSALQLAGFPHVIGTLWEVDDRIAAKVADDFYTHLRTDDHVLDSGQSAQALHHTIRSIRDQLRRVPSIWAAYLHVGA